MPNIPIYEAKTSSDPNSPLGIRLVSLVDYPAMEVNYVALSKTQEKVNVKLASEKRGEVTGPILIPNKLILREQDGEYFYIKFSEETIRELRDRYFKEGYNTESNAQHAEPLANNTMVEAWIIEDPELDKAVALGFTDLPKGTLMGTMKIGDRQFFDSQIIEGKLNGFSIEGWLNYDLTGEEAKLSLNMSTKEKPKTGFLKTILAAIMPAKEDTDPKRATLYEVVVVGEEENFTIDIDEDTMEPYLLDADGERDGILPDGEYVLEDGQTIVVTDGVVTGFTPAKDVGADKTEDPETELSVFEKYPGLQEDLENAGARITGLSSAKPKPAKTEMANFLLESGEVINIDADTGMAFMMDAAGNYEWPEAGTYSTNDGKTVVIKEVEITMEDSYGEYSYIEYFIDWEASTLEIADLLPWISEAAMSAVNEVAEENKRISTELAAVKKENEKLKLSVPPAAKPRKTISTTAKTDLAFSKDAESTLERFQKHMERPSKKGA